MTFDFVVRPRVGVGHLRFGMTRPEVLDVFRPADRQIQQHDGTTVDYYTDDLLSLSYDDHGELDFIEWHASKPATVDDVVLQAGPTVEVLDALRVVGGEAMPVDGGFNFDAVGIIIYAPSGQVEGVAAYRPGYYDDSLAP